MTKMRGADWSAALWLGLAGVLSSPLAGADSQVLERVEVRAPRSMPVWELRRGDDRLVVLSDFWPRRDSEAVYVNPALVQALVAEAEAYVNAPGVAVDDSVSLWRGMWMWRAYRKAMRNPGNAPLRTILQPEAYARWAAARTRFLASRRKGETWQPWYAAFKLYEAALEQAARGKVETIYGALARTLDQRQVVKVDARVRMKVDASRKDVREFAVDAEQGVACLEQTLERLAPTFDTADEGADIWDGGDLAAMADYFERVPPLERCWERLINARTAELQGVMNPYARADAVWLEHVDEMFRNHDRVLTYLPPRMLVARSGVVAQLIERGWALHRRS